MRSRPRPDRPAATRAPPVPPAPGSPLPAGDFAPWAEGLEAAIDGRRDSDVPCGDCAACCSAGQFIPVGPDEHDALRAIPAELLFPAPRMPKGHMLMGHDDKGRCPMWIHQRCSIYASRPRACRTYDCRVFAAAGQDGPEGNPAPAVSHQARRWRFGLESPADAQGFAAVRLAAARLRARVLPPELAPAHATQLAVLAFKLRALFVDEAAGGPAPSAGSIEAAARRLAGGPSTGSARPGR
jgi:Fe-S-cluster containining protein